MGLTCFQGSKKYVHMGQCFGMTTQKRYIVSRRFLADTVSPFNLYRFLEQEGLTPSLFESNEGGNRWGRYTLLIADPVRRLYSEGQKICLELPDGPNETFSDTSPLDVLRTLQQATEVHWHDPAEKAARDVPTGGWYGLMGYGLIRHIEPRVPVVEDQWSQFAEFEMVEPGLIAVYDALTQQVRLSRVLPFDPNEEESAKALDNLEQLWDRASSIKGPAPVQPLKSADVAITAHTSDDEYEAAVQTIRAQVHAGEAIQVVLARRFSIDAIASPDDLYRVLRIVNPSPYLFLLSLRGGALVGSSPEVMVRLRDGRIALRPIAGTRPRGRNPQEDLAMEQDLLADPKELAEHLMLVDLGRNDVGRVAQAGSVQVPDQFSIERYSHVMHIVSQVEGQLLPGLDALSLIAATFPAGTVSGAPKIRAMELISELETEGRGPYSGAVGYVDYHGNMDTCIVIRTFFHTGNAISIMAGAGIVYDSVPANESEETRNKAKALFTALGILAGRS